jgi:hypothetical protein
MVYEIVVLPAAIFVTAPDDDPIVAMPILVLLHVPPAVAQDNIVFVPAHTDNEPVMKAGVMDTVTTADVPQPAGVV